uniref:Putative secreted protein n=1 Tax=Anopheles triannulatus TaxID=58253 RepID=A0A2M4B3T9_9DIPT
MLWIVASLQLRFQPAEALHLALPPLAFDASPRGCYQCIRIMTCVRVKWPLNDDRTTVGDGSDCGLW